MSGQAGVALSTETNFNDLAPIVSPIEDGFDPDQVVLGVPLTVSDAGPVVPAFYLEVPSRRAILHRGPATLLLDAYARPLAELHGLGDRRMASAAYRMSESRGYRRLGYRKASNYALEELHMSGRTFRAKAALGRRLEELPQLRRAYLRGRIGEIQARIVADIATPEDEREWIELAEGETVRGLQRVARRVREARRLRADSDETGQPPVTAESIDSDAEPRRPMSIRVPGWMLGRLDAVLELVARVAGTNLPDGARLEMVAAEFLSAAAAPLASSQADEAECGTSSSRYPSSSRDLSARPRSGSRDVQPTVRHEDPSGLQAHLEEATSRWHFLPWKRAPLVLGGTWKRLAEECVALGDECVRLSRREGPGVAGHTAADQRFDGDDGVAARDNPWQLHRTLKACVGRQHQVQAELGRILRMIYDRRLWRDMQFASFAHYARERLGISTRVAERLIRLDREACRYDALEAAYRRGELSPLRAELLLRVMSLGLFGDEREAWIEYGRTRTLERLQEAVRWAEREKVRTRAAWPCPPLLPPADAADLRPRLEGARGENGGPHPAASGGWGGEVPGPAAAFAAPEGQAPRPPPRFAGPGAGAVTIPPAFAASEHEGSGPPPVFAIPAASGTMAPPAFAAPGANGTSPPVAQPTPIGAGRAGSVAPGSGGAADEGGSSVAGDPCPPHEGRGHCLDEAWPRAEPPGRPTGPKRPEVPVPAAGSSEPGFGLRPRASDWTWQQTTVTRRFWMTAGEIEAFEWALALIRKIRGPDWPLWACLDDLLDHFLSVYDSEPYRAMKQEYPLLERDGWRCRVPGCDAYTALHVHHIVYRAHGGGDEPENLVTMCDHHHQALHWNWIRCSGRAPDRLYWELGVSPDEEPIARIFGHRRLDEVPDLRPVTGAASRRVEARARTVGRTH